MVEFTGYLTGPAKAAFIRKQRKTGLVGSAIVMPIVFIFLVYIGITLNSPRFIVYWIVSLSLIVALMCFRPMSKKEISQILPQRIYANKNHIVCVAEQYKDHKNISDVSKVIDHGLYYEICFPFGKISDKFICQKDLLTKGSLEKFEGFFDGKIIKKNNSN